MAISGNAKDSDTYLAYAKKLGADRILSKPLDHDFFIGTVNKLLK